MKASRPLQYFTVDYLEQCSKMKPEQILEFLDSFRLLHGGGKPAPSRLISMKVEQPLLDAFRNRCTIEGTPYQTQIKKIMREWLDT
jgi:uncharacterized protein (DUF4415 family)